MTKGIDEPRLLTRKRRTARLYSLLDSSDLEPVCVDHFDPAVVEFEEFYGLVKHSPCPGDTFRGRCEDTMLLCMLEVLFSSLSDL